MNAESKSVLRQFKSITVAGWIFVALGLLAVAGGCGGEPSSSAAIADGHRGSSHEKILRLPMRTDGPKSLDPVKGSTVYDNTAACQVYETLVQYKYLARPPQLEPLLLAEMPQVSADGLTYRFRLKRGVRFQDDPCFPDGRGRELIATDVFYSWKRMADDDTSPKSWWLFEDTILGFDEYRQAQNAAAQFDYDAPVEGFRTLADDKFEVVLREPVQRFMWVLAMFQTSIVPREAVEYYGPRFGRHPVGTGPFRLEERDWIPGLQMVFTRNPDYHACYYPAEHMPEDELLGFHEPAGTRLPIADRVEIRMFVQDQPMWLKFRTGQIDFTQVPDEYYSEAFIKRTGELRPSFRREGIVAHKVPLLDFIFRGFNMQDPLLGGYDDHRRKLRQALSLATDLNEFNETFYNGRNIVYDGPIPPDLSGYPPDGRAPVSYRGPDLDRARELLRQANYPGGKGLKPIVYYTSRGGNNQEQFEMLSRQWSRIGVQLQPQLVDFSTLIEAVNNKKAPMFSFAWGSDYPDGENNLALFYGPNESPGSNHFNYRRPEFDELYRRIRGMPPSDERDRLYAQMRDMVIEDCPFVGSMARTRIYLVNPRLKNFKPSEDFYNWMKYLDVAE
jgi:oligopeptide transport system substrate-binding protein